VKISERLQMKSSERLMKLTKPLKKKEASIKLQLQNHKFQ
jgi:hypothetical protein